MLGCQAKKIIIRKKQSDLDAANEMVVVLRSSVSVSGKEDEAGLPRKVDAV